MNSRSRSLYAVAVPSVCLSVTLVHPTQPIEIFSNFLRRLVPWPSIDIHGKFYGARPGGTQAGWRNIAIFQLWNAVSLKRCKTGGKLVLVTNRKSYMGLCGHGAMPTV